MLGQERIQLFDACIHIARLPEQDRLWISPRELAQGKKILQINLTPSGEPMRHSTLRQVHFLGYLILRDFLAFHMRFEALTPIGPIHNRSVEALPKMGH